MRDGAPPPAGVDLRAACFKSLERSLVRTRRIPMRYLALAAVVGVAVATPSAFDAPVEGTTLVSGTAAGTVDGTVRAASGDQTPAALPAPDLPAFATAAGVRLVAPDDAFRLIAFHEASFHDALALTPVGTALANDNPTRFEAPVSAEDGPPYVVLSSRGRGTPATSAVDLVTDEDAPVASIVAGTVTLVEPYLLYGRHPDTRVEIAPDGHPDVRVVLIHLADVQVRPGDAVAAGTSVLAGRANLFPFHSHVDRYVPDGPKPHVHVEVKGSSG